MILEDCVLEHKMTGGLKKDKIGSLIRDEQPDW